MWLGELSLEQCLSGVVLNQSENQNREQASENPLKLESISYHVSGRFVPLMLIKDKQLLLSVIMEKDV